jgi:Cu/Ag efflux protein CusF
MFLRNTVILLAILSSLVPQPLLAQEDVVISGDVTKVDLTSGMITVRHEANQRLNLGQATDTFRVSEPIMLNAIRLAIIKIFTD